MGEIMNKIEAMRLSGWLDKYCHSSNGGVTYHLKPDIVQYFSAALKTVPSVNAATVKAQYESVCSAFNKNKIAEEAEKIVEAAQAMSVQLKSALSSQTANSVWKDITKLLPSILGGCPSGQRFKEAVTKEIINIQLVGANLESLVSAVVLELAEEDHSIEQKDFYINAKKLYLAKYCNGATDYSKDINNICSINVIAPIFATKLIEALRAADENCKWKGLITKELIIHNPKSFALKLAAVVIQQEQAKEIFAKYTACQSELTGQKAQLDQCNERVNTLKLSISEEELTQIKPFVYEGAQATEPKLDSKNFAVLAQQLNLPPYTTGGIYMEFATYFVQLIQHFGLESGSKIVFTDAKIAESPEMVAHSLTDILCETETVASSIELYKQCLNNLALQKEAIANCTYQEEHIMELITQHDEL